jgi:hypothetical protein
VVGIAIGIAAGATVVDALDCVPETLARAESGAGSVVGCWAGAPVAWPQPKAAVPSVKATISGLGSIMLCVSHHSAAASATLRSIQLTIEPSSP